MKNIDATEQAWKNGYKKGYEDGKKDAEEMKSALWEKFWPPKHMILTGQEMLWRCSACTAKYEDISGYNYCPFCGAHMEIETDAEDETVF